MTSELKLVLKKLDGIVSELDYIREHMVDVDTLLTEEEKLLLDESVKHEKEGKLTSLEEIEHVRSKARQAA